MNNQETYKSLFPSLNVELFNNLKVVDNSHFIIEVEPKECIQEPQEEPKEELKNIECCECETKCDCENDTLCKCIDLKEVIEFHY